MKQGSFSCRPAAPRSMKMASPLDKGDFRGVLEPQLTTLWVVDPKPTRRLEKQRLNVRGLQRARTSALMAGEEKRWKKLHPKIPQRLF
jgi:hypothetical protein